MSTKKIEGYADLYGPEGGRAADFYETAEFVTENTVPATLVLGKAFTKEEVEDMLREAISKTNDRGAVDVLTIINIAERRGLKP